MNARIDIKTPASKSLEGFPLDYGIGSNGELINIIDKLVDKGVFDEQGVPNPTLTKGDTITIEILA